MWLVLVAFRDMLHWHAGHLVKSFKVECFVTGSPFGELSELNSSKVSWKLMGRWFPSKALPLRRKMVDTPFKHGAPEGFGIPVAKNGRCILCWPLVGMLL